MPAGLLVTCALLGFVVSPRVLHSRLPGQLGEALKRPVAIGDISLNPFVLELVVCDLKVTGRGGAPFMAFRTLLEPGEAPATPEEPEGEPLTSAIALDGRHSKVAKCDLKGP